jgi:iron complex outermembrane receptor protein
MRLHLVFALLVGSLLVFAPAHADAQTAAPAPAGPVTMPPVTVTAQKEPADAQTLPVSVTAVAEDTIDRGGISIVSEAAIYAPNTFFSELTARKISNATFRGIGSSPANPGITTFFDGVPQLNTNSSSLTFLDVQQVEFVRGAQSALFGRNTLGGVVNVNSRRPTMSRWTGRLSVPFANESGRGIQGVLSGPLVADRLGLSVAFDYGERDGFTRNTLTGNDLDSRSAFSGKAQLVWTPSREWELRAIVSGERARDGDYALGDLAALRKEPFEVARDYEGRTDRDVVMTTILARRQSQRYTLSTITGIGHWQTHDLTDLDYSPLPLARRDNLEKDLQFTQEVRFASPASAPVKLSDRVNLHWQAGVFFFTQNYDQDAVNSYAPFLLSPLVGFQTDQHVPQSALDDVGVGVFGQATMSFSERFELQFGARVDHEQKDALLKTFFDQPIFPPTVVDTDKGFSSVSPQVGATYHLQPGKMIYASIAEGFKAGGFNPSSPAGNEIYEEEHAWHTEAGWKSSWADGRLLANASVFFIDWDDLQLNVPDKFVPGQFYIANVGDATSRGVEFDVTARPHQNVSLFGSAGYTRARFKTGSESRGLDVSGNDLPNTPHYTAVGGLEVSHPAGAALVFGRFESAFYGSFEYDPSNTAGQSSYSLTNFRAGLRGRRVLAELWVRNAFDERYIPIAFPYEAFAPSGFLGEPGRPRTFGLSIGVAF